MPDCAGDTPIGLPRRKNNRYLEMNFQKCRLLHFLFGRPFLFYNDLANLFLFFIFYNTCAFGFVLSLP